MPETSPLLVDGMGSVEGISLEDELTDTRVAGSPNDHTVGFHQLLCT